MHDHLLFFLSVCNCDCKLFLLLLFILVNLIEINVNLMETLFLFKTSCVLVLFSFFYSEVGKLLAQSLWD